MGAKLVGLLCNLRCEDDLNLKRGLLTRCERNVGTMWDFHSKG